MYCVLYVVENDAVVVLVVGYINIRITNIMQTSENSLGPRQINCSME